MKPSSSIHSRLSELMVKYGLRDWWLESLSGSERDQLNLRYKAYQTRTTVHVIDSEPIELESEDDREDSTSDPASFDEPDRLSDEEIAHGAANVIRVCCIFVRLHEDLVLAAKLLEKVESVCGPETIHSIITRFVSDFHPDWTETSRHQLLVSLLEKQIRIAAKAAVEMQKRKWFKGLPYHQGYKRLIEIYQCQDRMTEASQLCRLAREQGWSGHWPDHLPGENQMNLFDT